MNSHIQHGLLKLGVGLQNSSSIDWSHQIGKILLSLFKHLVQGVIVISVGAMTYVLIDQTAWGLAGIPLALVAMVALIKVFYFSVATGTVLATTHTVAQVQQHFSDSEGWYGWHGIGLDDDLIKDDDNQV